jgi:hypothetical protein
MSVFVFEAYDVEVLVNVINAHPAFDVREIRQELNHGEVEITLIRFIRKDDKRFVLYLDPNTPECGLYHELDEDCDDGPILEFENVFDGRGKLVDWLKSYED